MLSPTSSSSSETIPSRRKPRVSAEHTLNRVRENQRRHRARRRDHIATLEQKLAETEQQLAEARAEIEALRAERNSGAWSTSPNNGNGNGNGTRLNTSEAAEGGEEILEEVQQLEQEQLHQLILSPTSLPSSNVEEQSTVTIDDLASLTILPLQIPLPLPATETLPPGPPPCCLDGNPPATVIPNPSDPECTSCALRPAPAPQESTTLCSQAYVLIAQQNFRGIDAVTIRMWLYEGFRRAQRKGEGCRVENGILMGLLDFISGV